MRILFVSEHDIVRGPMARVLAEHHARGGSLEHTLFDSAGVSVTQAQAPARNTAQFLADRGLPIPGHRSKPLTPALVETADAVVCMSETVAAAARKIVGRLHAGKVVVLNQAVGLGKTQVNIHGADRPHDGTLLGLLASLRAAISKMVRMLEDGYGVDDLGVSGAPQRTHAPLDPLARGYVASQAFQLIERAFEPQTTESLCISISALGREVSTAELEDILQQDLHGKVRRDAHHHWIVVGSGHRRPRHAAPPEPEKEAPPPRRATPPPPPPKQPEQTPPLTPQDALVLLGIKADATFEEGQKKYRALLKRYHPDRFHDDPEFLKMAEAKAKSINAAWALVQDSLSG